jgi:protocatechuate 3,4-dioxygenase beta subunit
MDPVVSMLTVSDVAGEYVRSDIRDGEAGIEFVLDTQVLDVSTCEPVTNALVEIWRMSILILLP